MTAPVHTGTPAAGTATLLRLHALLGTAGLVRSREDLQLLLDQVAEAVAESLGYGAVIVNLRRSAWDDFVVAVVAEAARTGAAAGLLGRHVAMADVDRLLDERFRRHGVYFLPHESFDFDEFGSVWVPGTVRGNGPDGWHPDDALIAPLRSAAGELTGFLSLDDPLDGRRPGDAELEVLSAVAAIMAAIIEQAQTSREVARRRAAVEHLLRVSSELRAASSRADMLQAVCAGVRDALAFEKVAVYLLDDDRALAPAAAAGWDSDELPALQARHMAPLLGDPSLQREGCVLLGHEAACELVPELEDAYASRNNGRGPHAWSRHWLVVPLVDREQHVIGMLWADDPADRLLPSGDDLRALRAFANHAMTAIESARALDTMRHLAEHDPLTDLRNRRDFEEGIAAALEHGEVALLVLDLDRFKAVNDTLGHSAGDQVLCRFASLLRGFGRSGDVPTRLGGEEFALVLPGTGEGAAVAVAERLRREVAAAFAGSAVPVTVSVGIAVGPPGGSAPQLFRDANRALFAAKRLGRDRAVVYDAETIAVLGELAEDRPDEQLAAALLLAETLDLRDVATAAHSRTVGGYAERTARELGLAADRVERLRIAGHLHDIGKLGVADAILQKPGGLTDAEWAEMRRHPDVGARILEHANLRDIARWVRHHHERVDGRGYPAGLAGEGIPLESRVLAVADAYEAMTADRPYRRAMGAEAARAELERNAGTQFDARVVAAFMAAVSSAALPPD